MSVESRSRQQQSSHMLKTGRRGNPYCKDTHDLFATLIVSLDLSDRTRFFRTYSNAFTTDDACANLASLRFSQSNRAADPNDPQRIVTTTTTTTFSMTREIAKGICQHFMDARLIENAADPNGGQFKDRGIYQVTPKGLHVLERFITKNGISADHLVSVFTTQPICMKLLHLERQASDDDIHISRPVIDAVFRRFSGARHPNYRDPDRADSFDRANGVEVQDVTEKGKPAVKFVFGSTNALEWLLDFTTCCSREEAAELLAHFVRYGLIALHLDRSKTGDKVGQLEVRGANGSEAEFRWGPRITYKMTEEGRRTAQGTELKPEKEHTEDDASSTTSAKPSSVTPAVPAEDPSAAWQKDQHSTTTRLRAILDDPALRSLFRDFLRANYCDENLGFWIDVTDFRRRFSTTSSAVGGLNQNARSKKTANSAMETHQQNLVGAAVHIYTNYLAPLSPNELNIDHNLRADVVNYVNRCMVELTPAGGKAPTLTDEVLPPLRATQVQTLLRQYERIQEHIFRLLATDQVPRFVRTEPFLALMDNNDAEGGSTKTGAS